MTRYLVTGAAGFIGFHLTRALLLNGDDVVGIDNLNEYYDPLLKRERLRQLSGSPQFEFLELDLHDRRSTELLFQQNKFDIVLHMAAQAGVRYSLENPHAYVDSNVVGFLHVLEGCRSSNIKHLVYASSSSVYGANQKLPYSVEDRADSPVSLYAATKRANELMAYSYSHLFRLPTTGLRFFTVYGPWGRPDMALFKFVNAISTNRPIDVYNHGKMRRDFTYVDDIVEGVLRIAAQPPSVSAASTGSESTIHSIGVPHRLYNIGNSESVELEHLITIIERCLGKSAQRNYLPLQPGDVIETHADIDALQEAINFHPSTPIEVGVPRFIEWYKAYYG